MSFSAPTKIAWWIALILGVLGLLGRFMDIPFVSDNNFWFLFAGWLLFVIATLFNDI
ncbi:MAG: hypothetical protein ACOCYU_05955 [Brevefilum sp.]